MKKKPKPANRHKKDMPAMKWQTGQYSRTQTFRFTLPYSFLLFCRLCNENPANLLTDFMDNLSCGAWKREGRDKAKQHLINYALEMGYGSKQYTTADIEGMFKELDALGTTWPANGKMKTIDQFCRWRESYHKYWYKKWRFKYHCKSRTDAGL